MTTSRRALLSCHDKTGLDELGAALSELGFELLSTGGTAAHLRAAGLTVTDVADVTRFPEILDGRVKTLHPAIHAGILAAPLPAHDEALAAHGFSRIELVAVNLYPFAEVARREGATLADLVENIDVGGPTMLRAAAKNHAAVTVVVDPDDYGTVVEELRRGGPSPAARLELARKVFRHTAAYDAIVADRLARIDATGEAGSSPLPDTMVLPLERALPLRYGENPHQAGSFYRLAGERDGFDVAKKGKELSYNNILDVEAAYVLAWEVGGATAVVIKHGNPCGVATGRHDGEELAAIYRRARDADAQSSFGSVVALTRAVDVATAEAITSTFVEVVVAPEILPAARQVLEDRKNLRLVEIPQDAFRRRLEVRAALGGYLVQEPDRGPDPEGEVVTSRSPTDSERRDLRFAMKVCRHVKSNAIIIAKDLATQGIGAGQMSRIDSVRIAVQKAAERAPGSVIASDAFFPFPDSIVEAEAAGVTAVIQPGGSVKDAAVIEEADKRGLAMIFTGRRHFRH